MNTLLRILTLTKGSLFEAKCKVMMGKNKGVVRRGHLSVCRYAKARLKASLLILLLLPFSLLAQNRLVMTLGDSLSDFGYSIVPTSTMLPWFAIAGNTDSWGAGWSDVLVTRVSENGLVMWTTVFGDTADDVALDITYDLNWDLILTGWTGSFSESPDVLISSVNTAFGTLGWTTTIGGPDWDVGESICCNGKAVVGGTWSFGAGVADVLFLDYDGLNWHTWTLGGPGFDYGYSVIGVGGDRVLTGYTASFGQGGNDLLLSRINWLMQHVWTIVLGGSGTDVGNSVIQTSQDSGFVVTGWTNSFGEGDGYDLLLSKFDSSGAHQWTKTLGLGGHEKGTEVIEIFLPEPQLFDGLLVTGYTDAFGAGYDLLLSLFDLAGNHQWTWVLGGSGHDAGMSVIQFGDFFVTGYTNSWGAGAYDVLFATFDTNGYTCEGDWVDPIVMDWDPPWIYVEPEFINWDDLAVVQDQDPQVIQPVPALTIVCEGPTAIAEGPEPSKKTPFSLHVESINDEHGIWVSYSLPLEGDALFLRVIDASGRVKGLWVFPNPEQHGRVYLNLDFPTGLYFLEGTFGEERVVTRWLRLY